MCSEQRFDARSCQLAINGVKLGAGDIAGGIGGLVTAPLMII